MTGPWPWRLVGRHVDARATAKLLEVFSDGELVKTHARAPKGRKRTDWSDYPPDKVAFLERTPTWCRSRTTKAGEAVAELVAELLAGNALHHLRATQGVLRLGDRYGSGRLDAACARALAAGDPSYRTVKGILTAGLEGAAARPARHRTGGPGAATRPGPAGGRPCGPDASRPPRQL
jgi:hypothetical protein